MDRFEKIILGTVQFGLDYGVNNEIGKPSEKQVKKILDLAFDNGIRILDTAEAYGDSHLVISEYHKNSPNRFKIISKYKKGIKNLPDKLIDRVKKHIKDFDITELYGYLFHDYDEFIDLVENNKEEILLLESQKLIEKIGLSVYTNEQLEIALNFPFVKLIQAPFNLLDNDYRRKEVFEKAKAKGVEIHTRSAFLQGLFFKDESTLPAKFDSIKPFLNEIKKYSKDSDFGVLGLSLSYPLSKKYIDKVLIGVESVEQLSANIDSIKEGVNICFDTIDNFKVKDVKMLNPSNWNK